MQDITIQSMNAGKPLQRTIIHILSFSIEQGSHVLVRLTDCRSLTMKLRKQIFMS